MAIDEDNKKKPSRGERYRNLYDAYRDETEIDDDDFWSTLNGPVQEASSSSGKMPEPDDDYDDDEDDDDLADPEEIIAAQARAAEASARQRRAAETGARTARSAAEAGARTTRSAERTSRGAAAKTGTTRSAAAPNARASRSAEDMPERDVTAQRRKANRKKKEQERKLRRGRRMYHRVLFFLCRATTHPFVPYLTFALPAQNDDTHDLPISDAIFLSEYWNARIHGPRQQCHVIHLTNPYPNQMAFQK